MAQRCMLILKLIFIQLFQFCNLKWMPIKNESEAGKKKLNYDISPFEFSFLLYIYL